MYTELRIANLTLYFLYTGNRTHSCFHTCISLSCNYKCISINICRVYNYTNKRVVVKPIGVTVMLLKKVKTTLFKGVIITPKKVLFSDNQITPLRGVKVTPEF